MVTAPNSAQRHEQRDRAHPVGHQRGVRHPVAEQAGRGEQPVAEHDVAEADALAVDRGSGPSGPRCYGRPTRARSTPSMLRGPRRPRPGAALPARAAACRARSLVMPSTACRPSTAWMASTGEVLVVGQVQPGPGRRRPGRRSARTTVPRQPPGDQRCCAPRCPSASARTRGPGEQQQAARDEQPEQHHAPPGRRAGSTPRSSALRSSERDHREQRRPPPPHRPRPRSAPCAAAPPPTLAVDRPVRGVIGRPAARAAPARSCSAARQASAPLSSAAPGPPERATRLLAGVAGEHAVADRGALVQRDPGQPGGHRVADVLEVRGAAADHHAQRDDGVVARGPAPGRPPAARPCPAPAPRSGARRRPCPRWPAPAPAARRRCRRASWWRPRPAATRSRPGSPAGTGRPSPLIALTLTAPSRQRRRRRTRPGRAGRGPSGRAWCAGSAGSPGWRAPAAGPAR